MLICIVSCCKRACIVNCATTTTTNRHTLITRHYEVTTQSTVLPEGLQTPQVVKQFPVFYRTRIFMTVFITVHHLFVLRHISPVPALPVCFFTNCFYCSSTLSFPNGLFLSGFPTKLLCAFLLFPMCATCPAYLILLDLLTCITFGDKCNL